MTKIITVVIAAIIFILTIELIRREKLTFKYAFGWLIVSLVGVVFTLCDTWIFGIARFFGFELASNFIFFALLAIFVFMALMLTVFLCQQDSHNDTMAQRIGMLENEIEEIKKNMGNS